MEERTQCIRIAVTGPESTGKSSLCQTLAGHFHASWVPEVARDYLLQLNRPYTESDLLLIAEKQIAAEDAISNNANLVFCDTEMLVMKIWSEVKFGKCHHRILQELENRKYDLVLLCNTDVPWEFDPLREHPDQRAFLMQRYVDEATLIYPGFFLVQGVGSSRINAAIKAVAEYLKN